MKTKQELDKVIDKVRKQLEVVHTSKRVSIPKAEKGKPAPKVR